MINLSQFSKMLLLRMVIRFCVSCRVQRRKLWILLPNTSTHLNHYRHLHTAFVPMAIRLFEGQEHAKLYARYRPTYPEGMFEEIFKYCLSNNNDETYLNLAVDIGCGSGQSTRPLCRHFRQVIGSDVSEEQIKSANAQKGENENIQFRTGKGEDLSFLEDCTVDLITIAQALHWLNHDLFYAEVRRVLKPGGVFAAYGYGQNVLSQEEAEKLQTEFYDDFLGEYWDEKRRHIETHFAHFKYPFEPNTRIETENISIRRQMPLSAYIGYLSTWSAWQKYQKAHPGANELNELHTKLYKIYSVMSDQKDPLVNVYWPGFLMLCRKPV